MFQKLLSNLPFNPGLIAEVAFYGRRLRQEAVLRRAGFVFMSLALVIQVAAALYPAQNSLAASPNDILSGLTTKTSLLKAWEANTGNIRAIYLKFGITKENIAAIPGEQPNATINSTGRDWWSVGRLPLSNFGISGSKWGERSVNASGNIVYQRPLQAWDTHGPSTTYKAFHGKNRYGVDFWILQTCGNPTFTGAYLPSPPKPKLTVHKKLLTGASAQPGDTVKFRLEYQNTVADSLATNFRLTDSLSSQLEFVSMTNLSGRSGNNLIVDHGGSLGYSANPHTATLVAKVKVSAAAGTPICNSATASSAEGSVYSPEIPCLTIVAPPTSKPIPKPVPAPAPTPPPAQTPTPAPTPPPVALPPPLAPTPTPPSGYCVASTRFASGSNTTFTIHTEAYVSGGSRVAGYKYDIGSDGTIEYSDQVGSTPYDKTISNLGPGVHRLSVYVLMVNASGQTAQSSACPAEVNIAEPARVVLSKSVNNLTAGKNDAAGTTVKSGDELEFKLTTTNVTHTDYLNYRGQDYFGDVLQYADIIDSADLSRQGLSLDTQNYLRWSSAKLAGGAVETKTVRVKVKKIVPATNTPSTISPDYDCKITNIYGDQVSLNVDCPIMKNIEQTTTSLPNTGPGSSVAIGAIAVGMTGYFFARSRLIARELDIVRADYAAAGGA